MGLLKEVNWDTAGLKLWQKNERCLINLAINVLETLDSI